MLKEGPLMALAFLVTCGMSETAEALRLIDRQRERPVLEGSDLMDVMLTLILTSLVNSFMP